MTIADITARCSKFSGWNLKAVLSGPATNVKHVGNPALEFFDPEDRTGQSRLMLHIDRHGLLGEVYGRMAHWGITLEERQVLQEALLAAGEQPEFNTRQCLLTLGGQPLAVKAV
jgi:hypothetical protein